uniref:PepSY domain-containing protein n=1 Tax=Phenylobacterium glaciei TaxID=2803784 RepID=A0A974P6W7_9CAUL|nr:PepSY domain-containing protein [Phenylobacterium glaciei]
MSAWPCTGCTARCSSPASAARWWAGWVGRCWSPAPPAFGSGGRATGVGPGPALAAGPSTLFNLHHLVGFWICLPLAVVSLTGVYIAFPRPAAPCSAFPNPGRPARRPNRSAAPWLIPTSPCPTPSPAPRPPHRARAWR